MGYCCVGLSGTLGLFKDSWRFFWMYQWPGFGEREREREERELGTTFGPFRDKLSSKDQIGQF